jgi:hypothetical protein
MVLKASRVVFDVRYTFKARAVGTTVEPSICFNTVTYNLAATMFANGRQLLDCTFEAVKSVPLISHDDLKRQVILVAT